MEYILTITCPDRVGIVAVTSGFLAENDAFILESHQFGDTTTGYFFMRIEFVFGENSPNPNIFKTNFNLIAKKFSMSWDLHAKSKKLKALVMVSQQGHCLNALLNKMAMGTLPIEIPMIVSNHPELEKIAKWYETPFCYLPVTTTSKSSQEAKVIDLIQKNKIDFVILARYMQILSENFVDQLPGKIINIHHSFLPSFKGAKPYHQAFDRGVKIIGATAHYVTKDLDEGAIIEQEIVRVDHTQTVKELVEIGQDSESIALVRAVKWHSQHRVFLNGQKTVIFK